MKDKNGAEIRVGDRIRRLSDGEEATVEAVLSEQPGDWIPASRSGKPQCRDVIGTSEQKHRWEIIGFAGSAGPRQPDTTVPVDGGIVFPGSLGDCAALFSAIENGLWHLHKPIPRAPHELYAEFRNVVEETVRRDAPKVRVVTDFSGPAANYWLELCGKRVVGHIEVSATAVRVEDLVKRSIAGLRMALDPLK